VVNNRTNVSPEQIRTASTEVAVQGDTAHTIPADVRGDLGPVRDIAGRDKYGEPFGERIDRALDGAERLLTGVGDGFHKTGRDLQFTADMFDKANNVATDLARNLGPPTPTQTSPRRA